MPLRRDGKDKDGREPPHLVIGSTYRIWSLGSREERIETRGIFRGIVSIGTIDAIAMELASTHEKEIAGKIRVIPSHMVLALDVLESVKEPEEDKGEASMHYT
ncbi:MAG: hypothetical protein ACYDDF_06890 [Thermoplasmatota archaeon]